ncbi:MAG: CoA pyrophosphatase [Chloroflexota bacterium]|nr:CoA pyrophosphatase [Chloroflexota bacterium]
MTDSPSPLSQPGKDLRPLPGPGQRYRPASVLILLYPRAGEDYIVLMRRTDSVEHHKGQISLPGGAQDAEDYDSVYTALREAQEEIGLDPDRVEVVATLPDVYVPVSWFVITPVVARLKPDAAATALEFKPNAGEVAEIIEIPVRALREEATHRTEVRTVNDVTHTIHYYTYGPYLIWGATGRIIFEFLREFSEL